MRDISELRSFDMEYGSSTVYDYNDEVIYAYSRDPYYCELTAYLNFEDNCIPSEQFEISLCRRISLNLFASTSSRKCNLHQFIQL